MYIKEDLVFTGGLSLINFSKFCSLYLCTWGLFFALYFSKSFDNNTN